MYEKFGNKKKKEKQMKFFFHLLIFTIELNETIERATHDENVHSTFFVCLQCVDVFFFFFNTISLVNGMKVAINREKYYQFKCICLHIFKAEKDKKTK